MSNQIRVCVIGAGAAGLSAARHLVHRRRRPETETGGDATSVFETTVYEQSGSVGGTWVYDDAVGDEIHSSMYKSLKTNLPKEVMAFPDFPFGPSHPNSFLHHTEVSDYLQKYARHFGLDDYIRLNTAVRSVKAKGRHDDKVTTWEVKVEDLTTGKTEEHVYDSVVVCNGHYAKPVYPDVKNMRSLFKGGQTHSHSYRAPEPFHDKTVVVLGAAASGTDIGLEIASVAKKVYLSHNGPRFQAPLPANMEQVSGIAECVSGDSFTLRDGATVSGVDVVLFCTGYEYVFPFLDHSSCGVEVSTYHVGPLYKHMISIEEPSLCFVGIPTKICPFPQFHLQSVLLAKHLSGEIRLPEKAEMMTSLEEDWRKHESSGQPRRYFHKMGDTQWEYNRDLAQIAQEPEIPACVEDLYNKVWSSRRFDLMDYKKVNYALQGDQYIRVQR